MKYQDYNLLFNLCKIKVLLNNVIVLESKFYVVI